MISQYFKSATRIPSLHNGPGGSLVEGLAQNLWEAGYTKFIARRHIRAAEHFIYWMKKESMLEQSHKCEWGSAKKCTTALRMFIRFLIAGWRCLAIASRGYRLERRLDFGFRKERA